MKTSLFQKNMVRLSDSSTTPCGVQSIRLDLLRGAAAAGVLLFHCRQGLFVEFGQVSKPNMLLLPFYACSNFGHEWVVVFFVLSGYLVGGSVLRAVAAGRWSWQEYLFNRMTRLYVVLLPALILGFLWDQIGIRLPGAEFFYSGQDATPFLSISFYERTTIRAFLGNLLFLQAMRVHPFGPHPITTFGSNAPLWSLSYEFWYYIAFPVLILMVKPSQPRARRVLYGMSALAILWIVGLHVALYMIPWLMGALIHFIPQQPSHNRNVGKIASRLALPLFLLGIAGKFALYSDSRGRSFYCDLAVGLLSTLLIWSFAGWDMPPKRSVIHGRLFRRAAQSSYSLYLVHMPMLVFIKALFHLAPKQPNLSGMAVLFAVFAITVLYAQLIFRVFEENTDSIRRRLRSVLFPARMCPSR